MGLGNVNNELFRNVTAAALRNLRRNFILELARNGVLLAEIDEFSYLQDKGRRLSKILRLRREVLWEKIDQAMMPAILRPFGTSLRICLPDDAPR